MDLIRGWDRNELEGKEVITLAPGYKWNQMGELYQGFYDKYKNNSPSELRELFNTDVDSLVGWLNAFSDDELFKSGGRKWAASTASNWPIWKWVHINTVAPFNLSAVKFANGKSYERQRNNPFPFALV